MDNKRSINMLRGLNPYVFNMVGIDPYADVVVFKSFLLHKKKINASGKPQTLIFRKTKVPFASCTDNKASGFGLVLDLKLKGYGW